MKEIVLHHVRPEILASADWYQMQNEDLGNAFVEAVDEALGLIAKSPLMYPVVYREARRMQLKQFPFGVFFVPRDNMLYIFQSATCIGIRVHGNGGSR